jgi:hypothetical protein
MLGKSGKAERNDLRICPVKLRGEHAQAAMVLLGEGESDLSKAAVTLVICVVAVSHVLGVNLVTPLTRAKGLATISVGVANT